MTNRKLAYIDRNMLKRYSAKAALEREQERLVEEWSKGGGCDAEALICVSPNRSGNRHTRNLETSYVAALGPKATSLDR